MKEFLAEYLTNKGLAGFNPKKMRLRDKINNKLSEVYHNDTSLKNHRLYDRINLVIEPLEEEEHTVAG